MNWEVITSPISLHILTLSSERPYVAKRWLKTQPWNLNLVQVGGNKSLGWKRCSLESSSVVKTCQQIWLLLVRKEVNIHMCRAHDGIESSDPDLSNDVSPCFFVIQGVTE
jgi:hypothetical protein